jgi:protein-tyrosine kinase
MKQDNPVSAQGSLIERAADIYAFRDFLRAPVPEPLARLQTPQPPVVQPLAAQPQAAVASPVIPIAPPRIDGTARIAPLNLERLRLAGMIEPGAAPTMISEEFRVAKRQIMTMAFGGRTTAPIERGRAVMMCSSHPNEGKTFCAINLALSMASERDVEVLLVDADVAKPEVLSTLGIEGGSGLMDAVIDPSLNVEDFIIKTSLESLSVLPTGRRHNDDTELLASARTQKVIEELLETNPRRLIIIDTAPALAASPASALAQHIGQIVMVVRADRTGENELREAIEMLGGCEHIQLLLNGATYTGANQKFGSYYGYGG